jgi:hypothetical protein
MRYLDMANIDSILRKLAATDDQAPAPPRTGHDERSMKHFYAILAFTLGMILFGVIVAFLGFF